jgi:hypothetical protein
VTFYGENNGQIGASTTAANASYIQVTIGDDSRSPWKVVPTFLAAVGATPNSTEATARARVTYASCAAIQGFTCGSGLTSTTPGTQYLFFTKASGGNGNWGVIKPGDLALFTQVTLPACTSNIIIQETGNESHRALVNGMNTRFDHPAGNTSDEQTTAPIPIDSMTPGHGNSCNNRGAPSRLVLTQQNTPAPALERAVARCHGIQILQTGEMEVTARLLATVSLTQTCYPP